MPTYEYECTQCGKSVDIFQPITEAPRRRLRKDDPKPCKCGASVRRLIGTGAGIIFKGSGFYQTDYRSESYKKGAEAEKKASESKSSDKKEKSGQGDSSKNKSSDGSANKKTKKSSE